jgi:hypothetical protein
VKESQTKKSMRKVVFEINITTDGFCNHMDMIADDELHEYFSRVLRTVQTSLWGVRKNCEALGA